MKSLLPLLLLLLVSLTNFGSSGGLTSVCAQEQELDPRIAKWEKDIVKLEELNLAQPPMADGILFCGSSSIRRWENLASDMAPWPTIKRGYGGAQLPDIIHYVPRIAGPHLGEANPNRCRAVVFFVANDITGNGKDATPEEVADRFSRLYHWVRQQDPTIKLFWIEVTPCQKRWAQWPKIAEATKRIEQIVDADDNAHLISTAGAYLGLDGRPRTELFVKDQLHLSEAGYQQWAVLIKSQLHLKLGAVKAWEQPAPKPEPAKSEAAPAASAEPN